MNDTETVRKRIVEALSSSLDLDMEKANDVAFHLTDWRLDLDNLMEIYEKADKLSDEYIKEIIVTFLIHVPNHVVAAKKLSGLGPIEDVFDVGIFREDD